MDLEQSPITRTLLQKLFLQHLFNAFICHNNVMSLTYLHLEPFLINLSQLLLYDIMKSIIFLSHNKTYLIQT